MKTTIKQLHQSLLENPQTFEIIINDGLDGIWFSADGEEFWVNSKSKLLLGYIDSDEINILKHLTTKDISNIQSIAKARISTQGELEVTDVLGGVYFYTFKTEVLPSGVLFLLKKQYPTVCHDTGIWIWEVEADRIRWGGKFEHLPLSDPDDKPSNFAQWLEMLDSEQNTDNFSQQIQEVVGGQLQTLSLTHRSKIRGQLRFFLLKINAIDRALDGRATALIGDYQDITLSKYKDEQQHLSEQLYYALFHSISDGLLILDKDFNILSFNNAVEKILSLDREQILNLKHRPFKIFKPNLSPYTVAELKELFATESQQFYQTSLGFQKAENEPLIWLKVRSWPLSSSLTGERHTILISFYDITRSFVTEQTLAKTKELLERSNAAARIGTWEVDLKTKTSIWSRVTREIHEVEPDFVSTVENGIQFYKEGYSRERIAQVVANAIEKGEPFDEELQIVTAKGNTVWVRALGLVEFEDGECKRLYGTFQDINARKKLEHELIKQNERLLVADEELRTNLEELTLIKQDLEESEAILASVSDSLPQAILLINRDFVVIYVNKAAKNFFARFNQNIYGLPFTNFLPSSVKQEISALVVQASDGEKIELERLIDFGEGPCWYDIKLFQAKMRDGEKLGVVISFNDITERKVAEFEFQKLAYEYEKVFQGTQDALFLIKVNSGKFVYLRSNQTHQRLTGIPLEKFRDKTPHELLGESLGDQIEANYLRCWNANQPIVYEEELTLPGGARIWRTTLTPVKTNLLNGYIVGSSLDITLERQAQTQKRELDERIEKIVQHLPGFIYQFVLRPDGSSYFPYVSSGVRMFGHSSEELLKDGRNAFRNIWDTDATLLAESIKTSARTLELWKHEWRKIGLDGKVIWLAGIASPERMPDGAMTWYGYIYDITDRKNQEQDTVKLLQITKDQNQVLNEYAYITSHNIRSYVANLLGINTLLRENPSDEQMLGLLDTTIKQLDDTIHAMNELLTIEHEASFQPQEGIHLLQAVEQNIVLLKSQIESHAELHIDIAPDIFVQAIPAYLDSIINNLLTNAIKYRKNFKKAEISISAYYDKDEVVFIVADKGIGIDLEKHRNRLFKMRSRFHEGTEGRGLGLFFTRRQVEAMRGSISVESTPDVGTTFTVRLKRYYV